MNKIYDFEVTRSNNEKVSLKSYRGNVLLIVNTATECGLATHFKPLEKLYQKYKNQGLVVLGFPCNQFGGQEPVSDDEMVTTCEINFGVTFPLFKKIDVNGRNAHPLFQYLKKAMPGLLTNDIKWNFTKFLIDQEGNPVKRFAPTDHPSVIRRHIEKLLEIEE